MTEFPRRDAMWKLLTAIIREVESPAMQLRLIEAAANYGHAAASEAAEHTSQLIKKALRPAA